MNLERNKNIANSNKPKLISKILNKMRTSSNSIKTIDAYVYWIKDYIRFSYTKHPKDLEKNYINKLNREPKNQLNTHSIVVEDLHLSRHISGQLNFIP